MSALETLFRELRRRRVFRTAGIYVVGSWLVVQVVSELNDPLKLPDWVDSTVLIILLIAFPVAALASWFLDVSIEGATRHAEDDENPYPRQTKLLAFVVWSAVTLLTLYAAMGVNERAHREDDPFTGLVDVSKPVPGFSGRAAIGVMPFLNHSDDNRQDYFADGITEDLITALQAIRSFPIIARASTFQYKGSAKDLRAIAVDLGAGYIVDGSVRKVGRDVRINVRLSDAEAKQLWAENYTYQFQDTLSIQDQVVEQIVNAIEPELLLNETDRSRFVRTEDMEAWDYYLQALTNTYAPFALTDLNGQYVTPQRLDLARALLLKAVALDSSFASAYRLLNHVEGAFVFNLSHLLTPQESSEKIRLALEYGERARLISPFEPDVCSCQAAMLLMSGDIDGAYRLQQESLRHNPANAVAHAMMGKILQVKGLYSQAQQEINIAKRLSPRSMAMTTFLYFEAAVNLASGNFDAAVEAAERSLMLVPGNYDAAFIKVLAFVASGETDRARKEVEGLRAIIPETSVPSSGWTEKFPDSVAAKVSFYDQDELARKSFNDGLLVILNHLGW